MKNIIVFFLAFCISCNEKHPQKKSGTQSDSVSFFLNKYEDKSLTSEEKLSFNDKAYSKLILLKNDKNTRNYLYKIISNYYNHEKWDDYIIVSKLLLDYSLSTNDSLDIAKSYRSYGNYYFNTQKLDSSFLYYTKSEKIYKDIGDYEEYSTILLKKGIIQYYINDYLGADINLKKALRFAAKSDDSYKKYGILNQLGLVSTELKENEKAFDYFSQAIRVVRESKLENEEHQEAVCFNNIGYLLIKQEKYNEAIKNFNYALKDKSISSDNPDLNAYLIDNLAFCKMKLSQLKNPNLFYDALSKRRELNNKSGIVISLIHLSEYFNLKKDSLKSRYYADSALKISRENKIPEALLLSLKQSSIVNKKNSLVYSDQYIKINDSLQLEERKNIDRFARIELETDELRQANTQLSEQNRDILNYFAIAIVFGGFLFFARFQRLKARELALKQTQQQANEEIYRLIISHQNQLEEGRDLEKKRISKELHDGVLGRLFGLRLNLDGLNNFDDEETKKQRLEYLNELKVIEQDLREISHELSRENLVLINNFVAIINNLLEQQSKINSAKINTLISDKIDWEKVSNTIKINLYRILQESLQNINKHAEATKINVIFNKDAKGNLIFSVEDNGKGYNTNGKKTKGIGMNNIVERVHQCQGKIDIKSQIGKGTKIIITFPLENETINI